MREESVAWWFLPYAPAEVLNPLPTLCGISADTFITSIFTNYNAGALDWFDAGRDGVNGIRRGLVRFNLAELPVGSTITSAVVQLTVTKVPGCNPVNSILDLFRLEADWGEGNKAGNNGAPAAAGEATWTARLSGTTNWNEPGARNDAVLVSSASASVGNTAGEVVSWSGPGLVQDVQFWLDNPSPNFGWLLTSQAESSERSVRGFAARQTSPNAGRLLVGYTGGTIPASLRITSISPANETNVTLAWTGGAGPFSVQVATNLAIPAWVGAIETTQRNATLPHSGPSAFFRVLDRAP